MPRTGRPLAPLLLTSPERAALEGLVRRRSTPQGLALRCRIVLACATPATNQRVAAELGVTPQVVGRWRARFAAGRLAALADRPRPGGPRTVSDAQVAAVLAPVAAPEGRSAGRSGTRWAGGPSTRVLAAELGVSQATVSRIRRGLRRTSDH